MNVTTLVFLALALLWGLVLLPEVVRKISGSRRSSDSIRSFNRQLSVLDRSGRGAPSSQSRPGAGRPSQASRSNVIDLRDRRAASPMGAAQARPAGVAPSVRRRRQEILTGLGAAALLTLLCTVAFGGPFLMLHLLCAGLLIGYVALLVMAGRTASAPAYGSYGVNTGPQRPLQPVGSIRSEPMRRRVAN